MVVNYCIRLLITFLLISSFAHANNIDRIRFVDSKQYPDPKQSYFIDLLTLVLEASKTKYGDYQLQPVTIEMAQARTSKSLQNNEFIDLTWRMTSQNLEQQLQAIYFPILKGLMGNRIFIIRKNSQNLFKNDITLAELQSIDLGQGHNWPDTEILLANGFNVVRGKANFLFDMLKKKRFDYYPRALHEPWLELIHESELTVEKNVLLQYPAPIFFFVNKQNERLQQRLTYGLHQLLESGKFEQFFLNHKITSDILTKAGVANRKVFKLENPLLSEETRALLRDKRLWVKFTP